MSNSKSFKRWIALLLCLVMALGMVVPAAAQGVNAIQKDSKGTGLDPNKDVRVSIVLETASTLEAGFSTVEIASNVSATNYRESLRAEQTAVQAKIERRLGKELDVVWNLTLAANLISANVRYSDIAAIKAIPGVKSVYVERQYSPDVVSVGGTADPDMALAGDIQGSQTVWKSGYTGEGTLIAIIDTGLDINHQSFDADAFLNAVDEANLKLTEADVLAAAESGWLNATDGGYSATADDFYVNEKIPFGWNYIDDSDDITHDNDTQGEHGSHVAGIAAANRYVDTDNDGEYEDALTAVGVAGNAPDAQILVMKVFGKSGGAYDSDCVAAIEDAIVLGADAVNLSLGAALPGFAVPESGSPYESIQALLTSSDTVVVYSAGNAGSWADNTPWGYLYNDGVNYQFGGEAGSYTNSFTVASVDNHGFVSPTVGVNGNEYGYTETSGYGNPALGATLDPDGTGVEYKFVMVAANAAGHDAELVDLLPIDSDTIYITWRGVSSFFEKGNAGYNAGAAAVIVGNNQAGSINMDLTGYEGDIPVVSMLQADAVEIWNSVAAKRTAGGYQYITGTITVKKTLSVMESKDKHYTMSSFSSWGTTGDLALKPEISAFGGSIYSVWGSNASSDSPQTAHDKYELMSGTSMAAPQITGMSALVQQYLRTNTNITLPTDITTRALTQGLLMASATPMKDAYGDYYSLLQQGAGLANVENAVNSPVYITVVGQNDGKVKAEIGDDPDRTGVYTIEFDIHNLTDDSYTYALSADVFTQAVFSEAGYGDFLDYATQSLNAIVLFSGADVHTSTEIADLRFDFDQDGDTDADDAQLLLDHIISGKEIPGFAESQLDVDGNFAVDTHDVHVLLTQVQTTVEVQEVTHIKATIYLDEDEAAELDEFKNGTGFYVESFIKVRPVSTEEGVLAPELSIPVLGYYGNWTDSSMYEIGTNTEWYNANSPSAKVGGRYPYTYQGAGSATYYLRMTNVVYKGSPAVTLAKANVLPDNTLVGKSESTLTYRFTPIRNYGNGVVQVTDENGKLLWRSADLGAGYGVTYYGNAGFWIGVDGNSLIYNLYKDVSIDWAAVMKAVDADVEQVTVSVILAPEFYAQYGYDWDALTDGDSSNGELGKGAYTSTIFELDQQPPVIENVEVIGDDPATRTIVVTLSDNKNLKTARLYDESGSATNFTAAVRRTGYESMTASGTSYTVTFKGGRVVLGSTILTPGYLEDSIYRLEVEDASGNLVTLRFAVGEVDFTDYVEDITLSDEEISILIGSSYQLSAVVGPYNLNDGKDGVTWSSSDEDIVTVDENGVVTAVGKGTATITATTVDTAEDGEHLTATCEVEVYGIPVTATGVLGDENGYAKFFEYNFDEGKLIYGADEKSETVYPLGVTTYDADSYLTLDTDNTIYQVGYDGTVIKSASDTDYTGFYVNDIAYAAADEALYWTAKGQSFLLMEDDPFDPQLSGWNLGSYFAARTYGYPTLLAVQDEAWDDGTYSGDYMLWILFTGASQSYMMRCDIVPDGGFLMTMYPLGIDLSYVGYMGDSYSNMVVGDDGALYLSLMTGDTNEIIRVLLEDGENNSFYRTMNYLGDFGDGVWPGLFLEVHSNGSIGNDGDRVAVAKEPLKATFAQAQKTSAAELAASKSIDTLTPVGSLNSIEVPEVEDNEGAETDTKGVKYDSEAGTLTIPVYASESTNGEFMMNYDTSVLTFDHVEEGDYMLVSYVVDEEEGTVHVGFADEEDLDALVLSIVFTVDKEAGTDNAGVTLTVLQDGVDKTEITTEVETEFHEWGEPEFTWSEALKTAEASFTCLLDPEHVETVKATVTTKVTEATCTEDGVTVYTAKAEFEGETYTDVQEIVIPTAGHTYGEAKVTPATCTEAGKVEIICAVCEEIFDTVEIPATGAHVYGEATVTAPTCEEAGSVAITCAECGEVIKTIVLEATGHIWGEPKFTWSEDGKATATFTCENDGEHTKTVEAAVTGTVKTAATCEEVGTTTYTATVKIDGKTYTDTKDVDDIPALGHDYENGACKNCGEKAPNAVLIGDVNGDGTVDRIDYIWLKRYCLGTLELTDEQLARADINGDGEVDQHDYILLKRYCLGTYEIKQNG